MCLYPLRPLWNDRGNNMWSWTHVRYFHPNKTIKIAHNNYFHTNFHPHYNMAIEIPCVAVISMEWRPLWGSWNGNAHVIRFSRDWQAARVMFVGILVSMLEVVRPGPTISYSLCSLVGWAFWWQPHLYNYKLRLPPPLDVRERLFLRPIGPVWPRPESWSLAHFAKSTSFSRKVALILPSSSWVVVLLLLQIRQLNNGYIIHLIWMCE